MSYGQAIVDILTANADLMNVLTGGVYVYQVTGRKGLNRIDVMAAFMQKSGLLKPTCIVYEAETRYDGQAQSASTGFRSTTTPIIGWIYDNGDRGYDTIEDAEQRMYALLQGTQIPDGFQFLWGNTVRNRREQALEGACYYQFDGTVYGYRTS